LEEAIDLSGDRQILDDDDDDDDVRLITFVAVVFYSSKILIDVLCQYSIPRQCTVYDQSDQMEKSLCSSLSRDTRYDI
jgi:hypothetical protein